MQNGPVTGSHDHADPPRVRVCFVCTGNICRSPMADAVLQPTGPDHRPGRRLDARPTIWSISSAGTGGWHAGEPMDARARLGPQRRGYADHGHRARPSSRPGSPPPTWWCASTAATARPCSAWPGAGWATTGTTSAWSCCGASTRAGGDVDVPDPYYGDDADFDACLTMVEAGCRGLVSTCLAGRPGQRRGEGARRTRLVGPHPLVDVAELRAAGAVVGQVDQLERVGVVVVPLVVVVVEGAVDVEELGARGTCPTDRSTACPRRPRSSGRTWCGRRRSRRRA